MHELADMYPFNVTLQLFENPRDAINIHIPSFLETLNTLGDKGKAIITLKFERKLSNREIAEKIKIPMNSVQAEIDRYIHMLGHVSRRRLITGVSTLAFFQLQEQYNKLLSEHAALLVTMENAKNMERGRKEAFASNIRIDELDLSVRAHSALKRAGINTLLDLTNLSTEDLERVRNLGEKGIIEIASKLGRFGLALREVAQV